MQTRLHFLACLPAFTRLPTTKKFAPQKRQGRPSSARIRQSLLRCWAKFGTSSTQSRPAGATTVSLGTSKLGGWAAQKLSVNLRRTLVRARAPKALREREQRPSERAAQRLIVAAAHGVSDRARAEHCGGPARHTGPPRAAESEAALDAAAVHVQARSQERVTLPRWQEGERGRRLRQRRCPASSRGCTPGAQATQHRSRLGLGLGCHRQCLIQSRLGGPAQGRARPHPPRAGNQNSVSI